MFTVTVALSPLICSSLIEYFKFLYCLSNTFLYISLLDSDRFSLATVVYKSFLTFYVILLNWFIYISNLDLGVLDIEHAVKVKINNTVINNFFINPPSNIFNSYYKNILRIN